MLGGACQICGFDCFVEALEFHHEDPHEKEYQISSSNCHSLESDLAEAKKCYLVCANCHRGIHAGYYNNPEQHIYKSDVAARLLAQKEDLMRTKLFYCKDCGALITRGAKRCPICAVMDRRTVVRPSREKLKKLIRNESFEELGRRYHVNGNTIRKWCRAMSLPNKKADINSYSDKDWEQI